MRRLADRRPAKTSGRIAWKLWEGGSRLRRRLGHTMTIDSFAESAFRERLKRLRKEHRLGDRFPPREHNPK